MKFVVAIALLVSLLVCTNASAQDFSVLAGEYKGKTVIFGKSAKAKTTFHFQDGALTGNYNFAGPTTFNGTIDSCTRDEDLEFSCTWHDRDGSGKCFFKFEEDGSAFDGKWKAGMDSGYWTGKKQ